MVSKFPSFKARNLGDIICDNTAGVPKMRRNVFDPDSPNLICGTHAMLDLSLFRGALFNRISKSGAKNGEKIRVSRGIGGCAKRPFFCYTPKTAQKNEKSLKGAECQF